MDRSLPSLDFAGVRDVVTLERRIPGPAGTMQARLYVPSAAADPSPGLVWLHGGGWVLGSLDSHDGICRALASRARLIVVSVDYRLAPEHPFPAGADDAVAATRWVLANAAGLGIDPERVAVGGDSAGGNLAAVTSQMLRDDSRRPAFQLLVYPGTDLTRSLPSHQKFREGFFLTEAGIEWFIANAFPDRTALRDPRASPLFAKDLGRLPPALVLTGGFDPLRDEGNAYAEKMRADGTTVELCCAESLPHGFFSMAGSIDEAARMFDLAIRALRSALGSGTARPSA
jgi:acetyl esterase